MRNNLEKFLLNENRNKEIFEDSMKNKYKVFKENYDERFITIYYKRHSDSIYQRNYEVGGYFDTKDKCIYNANYNLQNMFSYDKKIELRNFNDIENKIHEELNYKIKTYMNENKDKIKINGKAKFDYLNEYDIKRIKEDINKIYIYQKNPTIELTYNIQSYSLRELNNYKNRNLYMDYLNDSKSLIEDIFKELITIKKEEIGFEALVYDYKVNYLKELSNSKNHIYNQIKMNRNIYQSMIGIYAKSVNINIEYGGNNLNFKFDFDVLKRALVNGEKGASTYGVAYSRVSDFIKVNKLNSDKYYNDFEFSHINFITYGKQEIYNKNNFIEKDKKRNKGYERGDR